MFGCGFKLASLLLGIVVQVGVGSKPPVDDFSQAAKGSVRVANSALMGNILLKTEPRWPPEVRAITATVTLDAVINPDGTVAALKVISGPVMLRSPAIEAVRQWRFHSSFLLIGRGVPMRGVIVVTHDKLAQRCHEGTGCNE